MAALLTMLFLSQPELTLTFVILGAVTFALGWWLAPASRARIATAIPLVLVAGAVALLVTSVFVYYALTGDVTPGFFNGFGDTYVADGLGFVVPTPVVRLGRNWFAEVAAAFAGGTPENGVYVGVVLALVVARYAITRWGRPVTRVLLALLAVIVVLMLGEYLHVDGHLTVPMPWKWIDGLPLFDRMAPVRLGVYMFLIVAVVVSMWLGQSRPGRWGAAKWVVAALGLATMLPNLSSGLWYTVPPNPTFFTTNQYQSVLRPGEIALVLPFATQTDSMLWQAETGFRFRMADGYLGALLPGAFAQDLGSPPLNVYGFKPNPATLRHLLTDRRVSSVLVEAQPPGEWPQVLVSLGLHGRLIGGMLVYSVPHTFAAG